MKPCNCCFLLPGALILILSIISQLYQANNGSHTRLIEICTPDVKNVPAIDDGRFSTSRPNFVLLAYGGTISAVADSSSNTSHYTIGVLTIHDLLQNITDCWSDYANVIPYQLMSIDSIDLNSSHGISIIQRLSEELKDPRVEGAILVGGTDAHLEIVAYVALTVKSDKPIVSTGAYRPHTAHDADGLQNIVDSVLLAATPGWSRKYYEVVMVFDGEISRIWGTRKEGGKFVPGLGSSIGRVEGNRIHFHDLPGRPAPFTFDITDLSSNDPLPVVPIFLMHTGFDPAVIEEAVNKGARGFVIGVYGNGYIPAKTRAVIRKVIGQSDIVVIGASFSSVTVSYARVEGMIAGQDWDGRQLRILSQLYLAKGDGITRHEFSEGLANSSKHRHVLSDILV